MTLESGILLIDKPGGMTSHDVVARVRRLVGTRKVGHAGTLDPMATGLLVLGINSSTRLLTYLVGLDKEYTATIRLGASTSTDDREGDVLTVAEPATTAALTDAEIGRGIARLTGAIEQIPSSVSAIKVGGKRAYAVSRAGESVTLPPRRVSVPVFELLARREVHAGHTEGPFLDLDVRVECSSGTYVRALARDLGSALGVGGHLTVLRRTRIGPFSLADAVVLDTRDLAQRLVAPATVARTLFPVIELDAGQSRDLAHGKRIRAQVADGAPVAAVSPDGRLIGLIEVADGLARPLVNFPMEEVVP